MKKVLASIHKCHSDKIFSGEKLWEVRKSIPFASLDKTTGIPPFEVYVYECGKGGCKKVIGKFLCVFFLKTLYPEQLPLWSCCLSYNEVAAYANNKEIFAWHVSEPVLFDTPLSISDIGLTKAPQSWGYLLSDNNGGNNGSC